jgi:hypothetical protein
MSYPMLEEAVVGVHVLDPVVSNTPRVCWPALKKLTLHLELGIADFIAHLQLPEIQRIYLVSPGWVLDYMSTRNILQDAEDSPDEERNGINDSSGESDTVTTDDESEDFHLQNARDLILECYEQEKRKLGTRFPGVVRKHIGRLCPDKHGFDSIGTYQTAFPY